MTTGLLGTRLNGTNLYGSIGPLGISGGGGGGGVVGQGPLWGTGLFGTALFGGTPPFSGFLTVDTLTGTYLHQDGTPAIGQVTFTLSEIIFDSFSNQIVMPVPITVVLDDNGQFSFSIIANNDPITMPQGSDYVVTEELVGVAPRTYTITVPSSAAGGTVDISSLQPYGTAAPSGIPTLVRVSGTYTNPDGSPAVGQISVQLSEVLAVPGGGLMIAPLPAALLLDPTGSFAQTLFANDDSCTLPAGSFYNVNQQITGAPASAAAIVVPHSAPSGQINILSLL